MSIAPVFSKLLHEASPLVVARAAVDVVYDETEKAWRRRLREGENIETLWDEPIRDPVIDHARNILEKSPTTREHDWLHWFQLKALLHTPRIQVLEPTLAARPDLQPYREYLHLDAYKRYGQLVGEVLDIEKQYSASNDSFAFRGILGELAILALLNRDGSEYGGAVQSSTRADLLFKVDASYWYRGPEQSQAYKVNMQISTHEKLMKPPEFIVPVIAHRYLGVRGDSRRIPRLIVADLQNSLSESESILLDRRTTQLRADILSSQQFKAIAAKKQGKSTANV